MAQLAALLKAPGVDAAAHSAATSDLNLLRKPTAPAVAKLAKEFTQSASATSGITAYGSSRKRKKVRLTASRP